MAFDIKRAFFDVSIAGTPASREELLDWDVRDRLGIVVDRPFGALDAGLMIMLAATAFYDGSKKRRMRPLYPDMYLLHAGGPWGCHLAFDFAPDRKEIMVEDDPAQLLRAINQVGITHLLLPDKPLQPARHRYKEPEAALDRIKQVFAYGPAGAVAQPDVRITSSNVAEMAATFDSTLNLAPFIATIEQMGSADAMRASDGAEMLIMLPTLRARQAEIADTDPDRLRHNARLDTAKLSGTLTEDYRRVEVKDALEMLGPR